MENEANQKDEELKNLVSKNLNELALTAFDISELLQVIARSCRQQQYNAEATALEFVLIKQNRFIEQIEKLQADIYSEVLLAC